jgi:hypothetical protein
VVRPGDLFDSTDPVVVGRENLFETVEFAAQRAEGAVNPTPVESATAAPGEKRSVSTRGRGKRGAAKQNDGDQKTTEDTTDGSVALGDNADGSDPA